MGTFQMQKKACHPTLPETSSGYLLQKLKLIWDELGQDHSEREKVLRELEEECLDIYQRKVDSANIYRARVRQALADSEAEYTQLVVSLGGPSYPAQVSCVTRQPEKLPETLSEQLDSITPVLWEMKLRKEERLNQFREVQVQIQRISAEIADQPDQKKSLTHTEVNEGDISLKKLEEYHQQLQQLHKEKTDRLLKVEAHRTAIHELASTMGMDSYRIISSVHPSWDDSSGLCTRSVSDTVLGKFNATVEFLSQEKQNRLDKVKKEINVQLFSPVADGLLFQFFPRYYETLEIDFINKNCTCLQA
ncbi:hypothetical protein Taro_050012, partial [Colocasia esculenta]|nr:hypothetical protein [Colocasia esculenta]